MGNVSLHGAYPGRYVGTAAAQLDSRKRPVEGCKSAAIPA